jgi:hypothetical protein
VCQVPIQDLCPYSLASRVAKLDQLMVESGFTGKYPCLCLVFCKTKWEFDQFCNVSTLHVNLRLELEAPQNVSGLNDP